MVVVVVVGGGLIGFNEMEEEDRENRKIALLMTNATKLPPFLISLHLDHFLV